MSQHVEVVQQAHDAFNRGDFDGFIELFDADCEYRPALETDVEGRGGIYRGRDGMRSWWRGMYEVWSEFGVEIHEVRDLREQVLVLGVFHGRASHTGIALESPVAQVVTFRAGKIAVTRDFFDQAAALKAVGLVK
jgi:ketosteroid isomerase-like protein